MKSTKAMNVAPGLLIAMPQLRDPNFTRAVVLMLEHNDEGSFGVVVNQESQLLVAELLSSVDIPWNGAADTSVWAGGPVMPGSCWVLHTGCEGLPLAVPSLDEAMDTTGNVEICDGLYLSTSTQNLEILADTPPAQSRVILGYSGWEGGQLAQEMAQGSWLHADVDIQALFELPSDELWEQSLRSMGIDPDAIVQSWGVH
ncbi:MAG: YqgE/AlgH family protein [Kofleriaceae bacterium]|nr:YqgE/AlgH family protein [Kofleriaceae bacterium]